MHEFSIGQRIVDAVQDELGRLDPPAVRLCKTRVVVGALHQIVPDQLMSAYQLLSEGTRWPIPRSNSSSPRWSFAAGLADGKVASKFLCFAAAPATPWAWTWSAGKSSTWTIWKS